MNKKAVQSSVAAGAIAVAGGSYKVGEASGIETGHRETAAFMIRSAPGEPMVPLSDFASGQKVVLRDDPSRTVFAVASSDISPELRDRLMAMCPTNKWVIFAGKAK